MSIKVIATGGTIDKVYNPITGELEFTESYIPKLLEEGNITVEYSFDTLFLKDSLEMDKSCKEEILQHCLKSKEEKILITHGTDTMEDTALYLGKSITNRVIVLTGAMIPSSFKNSDALFNLGAAMMAVNILKNGVYISMNGQLFSFDNVKKNREAGVFEAIKF